MRVFVVTELGLGCDCVVGVFDASSITKEQLLEVFPETDTVIVECPIVYSLEDY